MGEIDQSIKYLLQIDAANMLAYTVPGLTIEAPLPPEVAAGPQLLLDTLYRGKYKGVPCIIDLEVQLHGDPDMPRRMYEYGSRVSTEYHQPVLSVVLWLEQRGTYPEPRYEMLISDFVVCAWNYIDIKLFEMSARDIMNAGVVGLLPLVPFTRDSDSTVVEKAAQLIKERAMSHQVGGLEGLLAVLAARRHGKDLVDMIVRSVGMNKSIIEESPLYQEWFKEVAERSKAEGIKEGKLAGIEEGKLEGLREGKLEGIREGKVEGIKETVVTLLSARFGALDFKVVEAVNDSDKERLTQLVSHITTDTMEQIRQLLGLD